MLISFVFPQFISFHSVFHSFHGLMNSINWPASSVWVFIAQLGEHCSANAEATGSNPIEAPKIFFSRYFRNCLNCDSLRWSHTHFICIPAVHIISFRVGMLGFFCPKQGQVFIPSAAPLYPNTLVKYHPPPPPPPPTGPPSDFYWFLMMQKQLLVFKVFLIIAGMLP